MKFLPRRKNIASPINMTPLIDCMFLLVIFIMLAARFEPEGGIPVDLPRASAKEAPKIEAFHMTVTADGRIYMEDREIALEDVEREIVAARAAAGDPDGEKIVLVIHGDKEAMHGNVVQVLDAAARAKQQRVTIRTRQ